MRVLLIPGPAIARNITAIATRLEQAGLQVDIGRDPVRALAGTVTADILAGPGSLPCGAGLFDRAPRLKRLVAIGIGTEGFDLAEARRREIDVRNGATRENVDGMASATIMLMMALAHRLPEAETACRTGSRRDAGLCRTLDTMTIGLIGYGAIGREVARRLHAWNLEVRAFTPSVSPGTRIAGTRFMTLDDLVTECDLISLHAALNPGSRHLLDRARIATMKRGALLVNTARGGLVDDMALAAALHERRLGGAALDCFEQEPLALDHPLLAAPNTILTPHQIGHTATGQASVVERFIENIVAPFQPALAQRISG